jgi:Asp-tRNA(Asn)/Glu-tRNA(Gln) amidotransferase C subunit
LVETKIPEAGLNYISKRKAFNIQEETIEDLIQNLSSIQNVMKMNKNIYEGNIQDKDKKEIQEIVKKYEQIIDISDKLLQKYSDNDDIAITVVNIII